MPVLSGTKLAVISLLIFAGSVWAQRPEQSDQCKDSVSLAQSFCRQQRPACQSLHSCIVRRDTCVEASHRPTTGQECDTLASCMKGHNFSDGLDCRYVWSTSSDSPICRVLSKFSTDQSGCPGRIYSGFGLLGMLTFSGDIIDYSVDDFSCQGVNSEFVYYRTLCQRKIQDVERHCGRNAAVLSTLSATTCDASAHFSRHPRAPLGGVNPEITDGPRIFGVPFYEDNRGGEESGGGVSPSGNR